MTVPNGVWGHNAVFEKVIEHGTTCWKVFEEVVGGGHQDRKVLIGEIHIDGFGFESPLLFIGAFREDLSEGLHPEAERFFSSHIESRFIYQLADFMRETEKHLVESDSPYELYKLVE